MDVCTTHAIWPAESVNINATSNRERLVDACKGEKAWPMVA